MKRFSIIISITALLVSILGFTPIGEAAGKAVSTALFAKNAGKVNNIKAARTATAKRLLALDADGKFPASVFPATMKGDKGDKGDPGVSGLEVRANATGSDSTFYKEVTASCPDGKRAIGGAVEIWPHSAHVAVNVSKPNNVATPTAWLAGAYETPIGTAVDYPMNWQLRVGVICANA